MKEIQLTQGQVAKVDDEGYELATSVSHKWQAHWAKNTGSFYAVCAVRVDGKRKAIPMHRLIAGAKPDQDVDHINHDTLDNRRENLRVLDAKDVRRNNQNTRKRRLKTASRYKGVTYHGNTGKWRSRISGGERLPSGELKRISLGLFETEEAAALAYDDKARELFGEHACLNFPGPGEQSAAAEVEWSRNTCPVGKPISQKRINSKRSRFKGVYRRYWKTNWCAHYYDGVRDIHIGTYDTEEDAALAYDAAVRAQYGADAVFNFPQPGERSALPRECPVAAE